MKKQIFNIALSVGLIALFASCNDFLDMEPMSQITPENYYQTVRGFYEGTIANNYELTEKHNWINGSLVK